MAGTLAATAPPVVVPPGDLLRVARMILVVVPVTDP